MKNALYFTFILFISLNGFAHGEDKPGPNGGFIKMPGAFHTELVPDKKDKSFHVFLLDLTFKNPTVKNSSLEMTLEQKANRISFKCEIMGGSHYHCIPNKEYSSGLGKIMLVAKREDAKGTATYDFPLKWSKEIPVTDGKEMDHTKH